MCLVSKHFQGTMGASSSSDPGREKRIAAQEQYVSSNIGKYSNSGVSRQQIQGKLREAYNHGSRYAATSNSYITSSRWNTMNSSPDSYRK